MTGTISFRNMTAGRAGATCVSGINQKHRHASDYRFIRHECAQLAERPVMQSCPLSAPNRYPLADANQIFQGNCSICVFRFGNQHLTDAMIRVFGKPSFFARQSFQFSLGRPSSFGLQLAAQSLVSMTNVVDVAGRENLPIAVNRDIHDAKINAQRSFNVNWFWFIDIAGGAKKKHPFVQNKIALALSSLQQLQLSRSANEWDAQSASDRPDRNSLIFQTPGKNAVIISNAASWIERAFSFAVEFIRFCDFGDCTNNNLSGKRKLFTRVTIAKVMQSILAECICFPGCITHKLADCVRLLNRSLERISLLGVCNQLDLGSQFHGLDYNPNISIIQV